MLNIFAPFTSHFSCFPDIEYPNYNWAVSWDGPQRVVDVVVKGGKPAPNKFAWTIATGSGRNVYLIPGGSSAYGSAANVVSLFSIYFGITPEESMNV